MNSGLCNVRHAVNAPVIPQYTRLSFRPHQALQFCMRSFQASRVNIALTQMPHFIISTP